MYWDPKETHTDKHGIVINPGDIIICTDYIGEPWEKHGCEKEGPYDGTYHISIRDFNAHNIGYCETGLNGNCINLGHYSNYSYFMQHEDEIYEWFDQTEKILENFLVERNSDEWWALLNSADGRNRINKILFKDPPFYTKWPLR